MKTIIMFLIIGMSEFLYAESFNKPYMPFVNSYTSEGVYQSTNTGVYTSSSSVSVSSYTCIIHSVNINSAGVSSKLEIFNTKTTTDAAGIQKIANIDTTSKVSLIYDVYLDSGLAIFNQGTTPADITIGYRIR